MTYIHRNRILFIFLITAFLAVQWSSAHIHLAEQHNHDGSHHQHSSKSHLHSLGNHHSNSIDTSHSTDENYVVQLDLEYRLPKWNKLDNQPDVLPQANHPLLPVPQHTDIPRPKFSLSQYPWLSYSTVRLRAPPPAAS